MTQVLLLNNLTATQGMIIKLDSSNLIRYLKYAGDVNGDGISDIFTDKAIIYGRNFTSDVSVNINQATINISNITNHFSSSDGIMFVGVKNGDVNTDLASNLGSPYPVGDINKDGKTDIAFGYIGDINNINDYRGLGAVLSNISTNIVNVTNLIKLKQESILSVEGIIFTDSAKKISYQECGYIISSAGDMNNDGIDDFFISNRNAENQVGTVVYGVKNLNKTSLSSYNILTNIGFSINYHFQYSNILNSADLNGDGYSDLGLANMASVPNIPTQIGVINIIWGGNKDFIDTYNTNSAKVKAFRVPEVSSNSNDFIRYYADFVHDTNGDKFDELLIGSPTHNNNTGMVRLVLGRSNFTDINFARDDNVNVTKIFGEHPQGKLGYSVAGIGDINSANLADFAICAPFAYNGSGVCYVLYGRKNWPSEIYLQNLTDEDGYKIIGHNNKTNLGNQVVRYGDINNDGFDDFGILVQSENAVYIIYGKNSTIDNHDEETQRPSTSTITNSHTQDRSYTSTKTISVTKDFYSQTPANNFSKTLNFNNYSDSANNFARL